MASVPSLDNLINFSNLSLVLGDIFRLVQTLSERMDKMENSFDPERIENGLKDLLATKNEITNSQDQMNEKIKEITSTLDSLSAKVDQFDKNISKTTSSISLLTTKSNSLETKVMNAEDSFEDMKFEVKSLQSSLPKKAGQAEFDRIKAKVQEIEGILEQNRMESENLRSSLQSHGETLDEHQRYLLSLHEELKGISEVKVELPLVESLVDGVADELSQQLELTNQQLRKIKSTMKGNTFNNSISL